MTRKLLLLAASLFYVATMPFQSIASPKGQYVQPDNLFPKVRVETSMGSFTLQLDRLKARITTNNFLSYVVNKDFDKTIFHRVEEDYLIQAGGYTSDFTEITPYEPIFNESGNGLKNKLGSIAMAKQLSDAHSATSQFFINLNNNDNLDPGRDWGYAVFGEVVEGFDVIDAISQVEVGVGPKLGYPTVPKVTITIIRMVILDKEPL
ncbi:peptidylprolyl isomerase [Thalassotalea euphylliae]|uniref:peptidylprolyl isomerase n=1 Tax=Thalassotalea euphylliae TaxID=1655234 RepID=UPI003638F457